MTIEEARSALGLSTEMEPIFWFLSVAAFFMGAGVAWSIWTGRNDQGVMNRTQRYIITPILVSFCVVGGIFFASLGNHATKTRHEQLAAISSESVTVKSIAVEPVLDGKGTEEMTLVTTNEYPGRTFAIRGRREWAGGKVLTLFKYAPNGNWERSLIADEE